MFKRAEKLAGDPLNDSNIARMQYFIEKAVEELEKEGRLDEIAEPVITAHSVRNIVHNPTVLAIRAYAGDLQAKAGILANVRRIIHAMVAFSKGEETPGDLAVLLSHGVLEHIGGNIFVLGSLDQVRMRCDQLMRAARLHDSVREEYIRALAKAFEKLRESLLFNLRDKNLWLR